MCSLGSRLQSARVISSPSKNLRLETLMSSMLLWSISSGSGDRRYSSSFCSVFSTPRSRAATHQRIRYYLKTTINWFQSNIFRMSRSSPSVSVGFSWGLFPSCFSYLLINHMGAAFHHIFDTEPRLEHQHLFNLTQPITTAVENKSPVINTNSENIIPDHTFALVCLDTSSALSYLSIYRLIINTLLCCWKIWNECNSVLDSVVHRQTWPVALSLNHEIQPPTVDIALSFTSSCSWFNIFSGWRTANDNMIENLGGLWRLFTSFPGSYFTNGFTQESQSQ